uniref:Putative tick metalloprotease 1 n=1 Tax=Amblyomma cajennense TaxID=34607 RepID=A0A023FUU9_AMBCJ
MKFIVLLVLLIAHVKGSPKPKLVYPRLLEERSSDGRMVMHVHDDLTLNLRKASVAAPALRVITEENGRPVTLFYKGEDIDRDLYEDEEKIASVAVTQNENGLHIKGLVGPQHRIEPMPVVGRSEDGVVPHAIYEIEQEEMLDKALSHSEEHGKAVISERWNGGYQRQPQRVPENFTVELFVILDTPHHSHFSKNEELLAYLCVMINSVNLRYGPARFPRVKFMITGMDKSTNESYAVLAQQSSKYIFDEGTLSNLKGYAHDREDKYGHPDVVYLMTGRDVYTVINGKASVNGLGIGYVSSVCTYFKVALGEDRPGRYTGTHTLTHELAHVLGAHHDGDASKTNGHPGAKDCPWDDGHIMSYVNKGPSHHQFSRCSLEQIQYVVRLAGQVCWTIKSKGHVVPGQYPGSVVPTKEFCEDAINDKQAFIHNVTVSELSCKVRCLYYKRSYGGYGSIQRRFFYQEVDALDYMSCGHTKVCIQGVCLRKPEPDATTRSPVVDTTEAPTEAPTTTPRVSGSRCNCCSDCDNTATARPTYGTRPWWVRTDHRSG